VRRDALLLAAGELRRPDPGARRPHAARAAPGLDELSARELAGIAIPGKTG
jgi:hypothetical protein